MNIHSILPQTVIAPGFLPQKPPFDIPPAQNTSGHMLLPASHQHLSFDVMLLIYTLHRLNRAADYPDSSRVIWHFVYWPPPSATFTVIPLNTCHRGTAWYQAFRFLSTIVLGKLIITLFILILSRLEYHPLQDILLAWTYAIEMLFADYHR